MVSMTLLTRNKINSLHKAKFLFSNCNNMRVLPRLFVQVDKLVSYQMSLKNIFF